MKLDGVAKTALLIAAMRATETKRSDQEGRLFNDPFAEKLAGKEGFSILENAITEVGDQPAIPIRTRFYDDRIIRAIAEGIHQIVILAAGMDARAYRMPFTNDIQVFELDRQEVLDYKQSILGNTQHHCQRFPVAVDFNGEWQNQLLQAGLNTSKPTLWLMEGLLMYLNETTVTALFKKINALSPIKSILIFDVIGSTLLKAPHMAKQLQFLENMGAPWRFGMDDPENYMKNLGWNAMTTQPGEVAPERWPFPVAPRNDPKVPRSFFVEARKEK